MLAARGELLLMADADGATRFCDVERLERHFAQHREGHGARMLVAGSRYHLQAAALVKRKWYRNVLTHGFHLLVALAIGGAVKDTQCGFKLFSRAAGKRLFRSLHVTRWAFDVELFFMAARMGIEVREEAVTWTEIPGSKMRLTGILQMAKELLLIRLMYFLGWWAHD
jgi:dolichyl-phosphate beta-glucosyltransferase